MSANQFAELFIAKVRQLNKLLGWQFKMETACCGVTLSQCMIILELGKVGQTSMVNLAEVLGVDNSTLSRNINGMVTIGLVSREANPDDRRYVNLSLTADGQEAYQRIEQHYTQFFQEVLKYIPTDQQPALLDSFSLLVAAILKVQEAGQLPCCCGHHSTHGDEV